MISEIFSIDAQQGASYVLEKFVSIYTSKDRDALDPQQASISLLSKIKCFDHVRKKHKKSDKNNFYLLFYFIVQCKGLLGLLIPSNIIVSSLINNFSFSPFTSKVFTFLIFS